jgi:hypothetical protein
VDEEDLLEIEFIFCGPLVSNPIGKMICDRECRSIYLGKITKDRQATLRLVYTRLLVFHNQAILGG